MQAFLIFHSCLLEDSVFDDTFQTVKDMFGDFTLNGICMLTDCVDTKSRPTGTHVYGELDQLITKCLENGMDYQVWHEEIFLSKRAWLTQQRELFAKINKFGKYPILKSLEALFSGSGDTKE